MADLKFVLDVDAARGRAEIDRFSDSLENSGNAAAAAERQHQAMGSTLKNIASHLAGMGATLTATLTAPITAVGVLGLKFNAMQESARNAFTTMLGDGERAGVFLQDLQDFAAKTPFEFEDLVRAAQRMHAMGVETERVVPMLTAVGNAAAASGGSAEAIQGITTALGQMLAKGKVSAEEMMQLAERNVSSWQILADALGVTVPEAMDLAKDGAIGAAAAVDILVAGMNERFGGMMAQQSQTFSGLMSTIKDELSFLAGDLTTSAFGTLKNALESVTGVLGPLRDTVAGWSDETTTAVTVVGVLAAATGPLLIALGAVSAAVAAISTPVLAVFGAAGAIAAAGVAVGLFAAKNEDVRSAIMDTWNSIKSGLAPVLDAVESLFDTVAESITDIWDVFGDDITNAFKLTWELIKGIAEPALDGLADIITGTLNIIEGAIQIFTGIVTLDWSTFSEGLGNVWEGAWTAIKGAVTAPFTAVKNTITTYANEIGSGWNTFTTNIKNLWSSLWEAVKNTITGPLTAIQNTVSGFTSGVKNAFQGMYDTLVGHSIVPDLMSGIGTEFGKLGEIMVTPTQNATTNIFDHFQGMFNDVVGAFTDWKGTLLNIAGNLASELASKLDLGPVLNNIFGTGGGSAGGLGGLLGLGGSASSTAGNTAGGVSSTVGSTASGLAGGIAGGIISGLGSFFGSMRLEGTMNAVEYNTRATEIHLRNTMDQILWPMHGWTEWIAEQMTTLGIHLIPALEFTASMTQNAITSAADTIVDAVYEMGAAIQARPINVLISPAEAAVPALAGGTPYVMKEGLAYLHEGEAVVPKAQNQYSTASHKTEIHVHVGTVVGNADYVRELARQIDQAVRHGYADLTATKMKI